jgi:hypothetical protein
MNSVKINTIINNSQVLLTDLNRFNGKPVEIFINEIIHLKPNLKIWHYSGKVDLKGNLDTQNIRDLAYE